ncbi:MAG TPA: hypothetical protein VGK67_39890 [Myxococcales bacterium]
MRKRLKVDVRPQKGGPLIGWLGQRISGARELASRRFAVDRYYDLAIDPEAAADPAGAFRAHVNRPGRGLEQHAPEAQARLKMLLGHYHPSQSLSSPDALVFNVFSPFGRPRVSRRWLNEVLAAAFGPQDYPADWIVRMWYREEVEVQGLAATIEVEEACSLVASGGWKFLVAAAWQEDLPDGVADTVTLSAEPLRQSVPEKSGLLVIVPSPAHYPPAHDASSVFRRYFMPQHDGYLLTPAATSLPCRIRVVTWESLGERADVHPHGVELRAYVGWRVALVEGAQAEPAP